MHLKSVAGKLFVAIGLPALVVSLLGLALLWQQTELAVRSATEKQAVGLAHFLATSFGTVDEMPAGTPPRAAHRAVTAAVRSNWAALEFVSELRVVGKDGRVRWSRRIEEEDKPSPDAERLLRSNTGVARFESARMMWPWSAGGGGEVVMPLGGVSCAGCHAGGTALHVGALQLTVDEPALRTQVSDVFLRAIGSVLVFALVLIAAVAVSLRLYLTRPLTRLAAAMKRAEEGDLLVRAPPMGTDEIGLLARAFNAMLARLTDMQVSEIDNQRDLDHARDELKLKAEVELLNGRLETRLEELQLLFEISRATTSTLELDEVLDRVTRDVPTRLGVPKFSLMLLNDAGQLEVVKAHPPNLGSEGLTFAVGEGVAGRAAQTVKSVYVPDLETTQLFRVRRGEGGKGRGCLLAVPMAHGPDVLGVLNFERPTKGDFSAEEIEFFTAVTDQTAMAVQNARLYAQTVALSITDPLTGAPNRRHFFAQLDSELNRAKRFGTSVSMLMIDIDHFKKLNDAAGHSAGDEVLKAVSDLLRQNVRKVDTLARYGGEEFVVLLPRASRQEALDVAEKLRAAVAGAPIEQGKAQPGGKVTISVGVSTFPADAGDQATFIDCADAALYASKRGGRNLVHAFEPGMELHPGRERGPQAQKRHNTGEVPVVKA